MDRLGPTLCCIHPAEGPALIRGSHGPVRPTVEGQDTHEPKWMWYVDAARSPVGFLGAVWGTALGCRIEVLPDWTRSQQLAEWGIIQGIKPAAHMGLKAIHIVADNLAVIWSAIRLTRGVGNPCRARLLRRLTHVVRRTKIPVLSCENLLD